LVGRNIEGVGPTNTLCGVGDKEAVLYLLLSVSGWLYFSYQYLYESGLGIAVPRYAGY
jgi:hypothetical protein